MLHIQYELKTRFVGRVVLPAVLLGAGLAQMAGSQNKTNVAKNGCFAKDATINYAVTGDAEVGFAAASDIDVRRNPLSPAVRFVAGSSVKGTLLVLNRSRVTISSIKIATDLVANDGSAVVFSGGSVGGSVLAQNNSAVSVSGGSMSGLFASDSSTVSLSGGKIANGMVAEKNATFNVSGGNVGKRVMVNNTATLNLIGPAVHSTLTEPEADVNGISYTLYTLSGKFRDGTSVNGKLVLVQNKSGAKLTINNAPAKGAPAARPGSKMPPAH